MDKDRQASVPTTPSKHDVLMCGSGLWISKCSESLHISTIDMFKLSLGSARLTPPRTLTDTCEKFETVKLEDWFRYLSSRHTQTAPLVLRGYDLTSFGQPRRQRSVQKDGLS